MRWFGETWNATFCRRGLHAATPVGQACAGCTRPIELHDQGFLAEIGDLGPGERPFHRVCFYGNIGIKLVVHFLWYGLPLCRFSTELPRNWPNGHVWSNVRSELTCADCRRVYDEQHPV